MFLPHTFGCSTIGPAGLNSDTLWRAVRRLRLILSPRKSYDRLAESRRLRRLMFELTPGAEFLLLVLPLSNQVPIEHPRISSARSTTTLASNQVVQLPDATMNTLFPDACRKCSYKSALKAARKKINEMHPAIRSPSLQSAMDTTKCPEVIRMTANQLTWSFGAGRIFAARNKCPTASIQCATTTSRASIRDFVISRTVSLWERLNNYASLAQKGKGRRDFSRQPLFSDRNDRILS